ncbi:MAG: glycosyltransferase [Cyclobacteriaceae bacterium]
MKIYLFTRAFPYGFEESFLAYEIDVLSKVKGLKITLIPREILKERRELPRNVTVDNSYADAVALNSEKKIYPVLFNFYKIIEAVVSHGNFSLSAIRDVASFVHYGNTVEHWATTHLKGDELIYTYWCDVEAYGLSLYKLKRQKGMRLVSRTHGFDIYEENRPHGFIPFRKEVLTAMNRVFCISGYGVRYLKKKHDFTRASSSYLGVLPPKNIATERDQNLIRIVTCSSLAKVKRLPLIVSSIIFLARKHQNLTFEWVHIGGNVTDLRTSIEEKIPDNLTIDFKGQLPNSELHHFYSRHFVNAFLNLSKSEGIPVSMMEAMSYGIPVVGTAVGGVPEIVDFSNGFLVSKNPSSEEVSSALMEVVYDESRRSEAMLTFDQKFNADNNFRQFAESLQTINAGVNE